MHACTLPEGFRLVPGNAVFAVNENGLVFSTRLNRTVTISKQKTGYRTVAYRENDKTKTFYVHRLVALTFIPVPDDIENPEVNHKDGNKDNNTKDNLEWVSSSGNKKHAIDTGLCNFKRVKAKNLLTEQVVQFSTCEEAARAFGIPPKKLKKHLTSELAGKITKGYWVFLFEDQEWPKLTEDEIIEDRWSNSRGLWIVTKENKRYVASSLELACEGLGLKYYSIQPEVKADGSEYVVQGYSFYYSNLPTKQMIEAAVYSEETPKFRPKRTIRVTFHSACNATREFESLRKASAALGIPDTTILYALERKAGRHNEHTFEYV